MELNTQKITEHGKKFAEAYAPKNEQVVVQEITSTAESNTRHAEINANSSREFKELVKLLQPYIKRGEEPDKNKIFFDMQSFKQWANGDFYYHEQMWQDARDFLEKKMAQKTEERAKKKAEQPTKPIAELRQFEDVRLFKLTHEELSKRHLYDDRQKLTGFLFGCTAYLVDPRDRKSVAYIGDSSVGKDNIVDTILSHLPAHMKLTNASQAVLEDDLSDIKIVAFSEMNANRENGANKDLTEAIKQMAEGGMASLKKDTRDGFKSARLSEQEQKTIFYGTTEEKNDPELETRFTKIGIPKDARKVGAVNTNSLRAVASPEAILRNTKKGNSWIYDGLLQLETLPVVISYAPKLAQLFDTNDPRSQRDVKRILALTKAHAWYHQKQRPIIEYEGQRFILALPVDFINVYKVSAGFFNLTYAGLEPRLQEILDFVRDETGNDLAAGVARATMQEKLGVPMRTLKRRLKLLQDSGHLRLSHTEGKNDWKYYRCQTQCQTGLISANLEEVRKILTDTDDPLLAPHMALVETSKNAEIDVSSFFEPTGAKSTGDDVPSQAAPVEDVKTDDCSVPGASGTGQVAPVQTKREFFLTWVGAAGSAGRDLSEARTKWPQQTEICLREGQIFENPAGTLRVCE